MFDTIKLASASERERRPVMAFSNDVISLKAFDHFSEGEAAMTD